MEEKEMELMKKKPVATKEKEIKKMRKHKKKSLTYQAPLKSSLGQEEGEQ